MYLKRIEIAGFKSFAQRTEFIFEKGITAIVGPNGSGKSNISDAVMWVLGEQSAKNLRGSKMEDVIFSGTQSRKPLGYCEVSLVFDNSDGVLACEFSEVSVTRRAYRSGENEYFINRKNCRLKDIAMLFHDTGIGKQGYSIIGQGRISDILNAKSEGRRLVLEEAAGIMKYKTRKLEAERKLEQTKQNITRIDDIVSELENQLEPLERQSAAARKYAQLRDKLKALELNLFVRQYESMQERRRSHENALNALSEEYSALCGQESRMRESGVEGRIRELDGEIAVAQQQLAKLGAGVERREGELRLLLEKSETARRENTRLRGEIEALERAKAAAEEALAKKAAGIESLVADMEGGRLEVETASREYDKKNAACEDAERALEEKKNAIIAAMNSLSDTKSKASRLAGIRAMAQARLGAIAAEQAKEEENREALSAERAEAQAAFAAAAAEKADLEEKIAELKKRGEALRAEAEAAQKKLHAFEAKANEKKSRISMLNDMKRHYEGFAASVRQILKSAETDVELKKGVLGVVANLIRVPRELETAVETALGQALQNIVTETEEDAKRIIEFLRRNGFGRATFMPLSAAKPRLLNANERQAIRMPGVLGVASELVGYDRMFEGAIGSLLGRTVITEDLDTAIALMRKTGYAFRTVTKKGDILSPGGTITGGSLHARETGLLARERAIEDEKKLLIQTEEEAAQARRELDALAAELLRLQSEHAAIKAELSKAAEKAAREKEKLDTVEIYFNMAAERLASHENEKSQLLENIADVERELDRIEKQQVIMESASLQTQSDIENEQNALGAMKKERDTLLEALNAKRMRLFGVEKELKAARDEIAWLEAEKKRSVSAASKLLAELERNNEVIESLRLKQTEDIGLASEQKVELERQTAKLAGLEESKAALYIELEAEKERRERLRADMEANTERRHKAELQVSRLEAEMENLSNRIWEEYELTYAGALEYKSDIGIMNAQAQIEEIKAAIRELGPINPAAIEEYRNVCERHAFLTEQRADLLRAQEHLTGLIHELMATMREQFKKEFAKINENFSMIFARVFGGGKACMRLAHDGDVLESDIEIEAQPPGKKLQVLSLLSSGEKTLVALTLLFAILKLRPAPFCILDEVDTALDENNVDSFARYLKDYSDNTQFILITHRKNSMAVCDTIYGVAMEEKGISRTVSVRISEQAV